MRTYLFFIFLSVSSAMFAQEIDIEFFQEGFTRPLNLQNAGDDRLFVVEQGGKIKVVQSNGSVNADPFLDISSIVSSGGESGLLGLAFHPDFPNNGYFYVNYTKINGDTQVSRFSVDAENPDIANANSQLPIIEYQQPYANHNGGAMAFGADGFLYISSGDGGGSGDPDANGQNLNVLLGKILRIDIDSASAGKNYAVPADNPFVGIQNAQPEIWAYGLRNPWRFSFDEASNTIWIADVGQTDIEEINRQQADEGGINYGWRCYEGNLPFNTQNCPAQSDLTFPFAEYEHVEGNCSISGGYVYRGTEFSDIEGLYFFADYCSGMIGTVDDEGNLIDHGNFSGRWVSFGEDVHKELYILDIEDGKIYKIKGGERAGTEDWTGAHSFYLIPNPASDFFSVVMEQETFDKIQIYDLRGRLIHQEVDLSVKEQQIEITTFESGIYLVQAILTNGSSLTRKLIIK